MPTSTWFRLNVAKRERVLEVAMREFGENGYSTGSLNTIAREAGIAKGSLFQYFGDKSQPSNRYTSGRRYQLSLQFKF